MKVILMKDVVSLGREGDVVNVSDGHALNFLFPQSLAVQATEEALARIAARKKKEEKVSKAEMDRAADLARVLDGMEVTLKEKVNEQGKLYAALSQDALADALKKSGKKLDPSYIRFRGPIKEIGEYTVDLALPHKYEAQIRVIIESK